MEGTLRLRHVRCDGGSREERREAMRLWREMGDVRKKKALEIQWKAEGVRSFVLPWSADARCGGA